MREIIIPPQEADRRLDKFLFQYFNNAPHSFIYRMLRTKKIKLNGKRAQGGETVLPGDLLAVYLTEEQLETCIKEKIIPQAKEIPEIIFEDKNVLVINKPAGLASHGGQNPDHLLARVLYYLKEQNLPSAFSPAICNRLDVNTSGVVVCAKTFAVAREINGLFAERKAEREYLAVAHGKLAGGRAGEQTLKGFYRKDEVENKACIRAEVFAGGEVKVETAFKTVCVKGGYTLLKVFPVTGRSHQIRAHFASIGHPLLGDVKYGGTRSKYAPAQLLHCGKVVLNGQAFAASPPEGFLSCAEELFDFNLKTHYREVMY